MGLGGGDLSLDFISWFGVRDGGGVAGFAGVLFFLVVTNGAATGDYESVFNI